MKDLLYTIPANTPKEDIIRQLREYPEIKFVSLVDIDLAGNDINEKIPVRLFLTDIDEFYAGAAVQTDGSSVVLPGIATLNNAKVDMPIDPTVNWFVDYNFEYFDDETNKPVGTLRIPSFLIHEGSMASTKKGARLVEDYLAAQNFVKMAEWLPVPNKKKGLDIQRMPYYIFRNYDYPEHITDAEEREALLLDTRLELRKILTESDQGYVYSFWPDVLTLKEIGDPRDIATYFRLWDDNETLLAKNIIVQCRQNTNYKIVRYAAHPFFLQGYTLCANGENTFYTKNKEFQKNLHRGYIGFESDSQNFLYTLHYVLHELKWSIPYYKHVITPLPFAEIAERPDKEILLSIRQSLAHLEINGPNTIIAGLPDGRMMTCCDSTAALTKFCRKGIWSATFTRMNAKSS